MRLIILLNTDRMKQLMTYKVANETVLQKCSFNHGERHNVFEIFVNIIIYRLWTLYNNNY